MTNYQKIEMIIKKNKGYVTREDVMNQDINSWFLYDYAKRYNLVKIDNGFFAKEDWLVDEYLVYQLKYKKIIYSFYTALMFHELTDKMVDYFEVSCPHGYNVELTDKIVKHSVRNKEIYDLGVIEIETIFGNKVKVYDMEKTICDLVKNKVHIESEVYIKAIRKYIRKKDKNIFKLFKYARIMKIEKEVNELMEILLNDEY